VGKPEGSRLQGRTRRIYEDNIKIDLQELGCRDMDWIELAQDRDRERALNVYGKELSGSVKRREFLD
jgi:hypothetical protein